METIKETIAKDLLSIKAVFFRPNEPFTWASGIKSPVYCDNRLILTAPAVRGRVEAAIAETVRREYPETEVLMGTSTAGIAHAAIAAHLMGLPMGYVRSGAKDHGRQNRIEGKLEAGQKVVVIEDLISTGGSVIEVVEALREVGAEELNVWREKLSLDRDDFCVGICARLESCKGHDVFLRAAKQAVGRMPNRRFRFLVIGDGSRRAELERMTAQSGLSEAVRFTGFVPDVAPLYRLMRLHVNASRGTETSCLAVSEAMSAGVPELVSDYGGNREMIGESLAGIVFPEGNAGALADAICRVAGDGKLEASMRRAAALRYRRLFTAERMTDRLMAVYRGM